jgi:hypothetical protein
LFEDWWKPFKVVKYPGSVQHRHCQRMESHIVSTMGEMMTMKVLLLFMTEMRGSVTSMFWPTAGGMLRKRVHYFSWCGTWTDNASTRGCANIPFPLLMFSACSNRSSLATSHLMLSISF